MTHGANLNLELVEWLGCDHMYHFQVFLHETPAEEAAYAVSERGGALLYPNIEEEHVGGINQFLPSSCDLGLPFDWIH